jgi:hypothetical protein
MGRVVSHLGSAIQYPCHVTLWALQGLKPVSEPQRYVVSPVMWGLTRVFNNFRFTVHQVMFRTQLVLVVCWFVQLSTCKPEKYSTADRQICMKLDLY